MSELSCHFGELDRRRGRLVISSAPRADPSATTPTPAIAKRDRAGSTEGVGPGDTAAVVAGGVALVELGAATLVVGSSAIDDSTTVSSGTVTAGVVGRGDVTTGRAGWVTGDVGRVGNPGDESTTVLGGAVVVGAVTGAVIVRTCTAAEVNCARIATGSTAKPLGS